MNEREMVTKRGSSIPSFGPQISCDNVIQMVIFGIPPQGHTFNPENRPNFALKSRIPASFK